MESDEESLAEGVKILMYKSQTQAPEESRKIRDKYQELIEDARKEKEKEKLNTDNIIQSMNQADKLFKDVCRPQEAMYDSKLVGIHSEIAKKHAHQLTVGNPFNSAIFLKKLAYELTGTHSDYDVHLNENAWLKLGNRVLPAFKMTPKLNYMYGKFPGDAVHTSRQRRSKGKDSKPESVDPKVITGSNRKGVTDKTYAEIQRIKKILFDMYRRNGGVPICYFHFTIDPNSFARTVENMFHLSFLIKEREVCLRMDSNELPVIEPLIPDSSTAATETSQSVFTMNVEKWKQLIKVFEIKRPSIPPSRSLKPVA